MKLIFGLGNPGPQYQSTRHNVGFMALDYLQKHFFSFSPFKEESKHKAAISEGFIAGEKVLLIKPLTFMNLSGQSARSVMQFYKVDLEDLIFVYDEVDIEFGNLRLRKEGSAGGHNGVKSLIQELGSQEFVRIRIGIKPEKPFPGELADYVLGRLSIDERIQIDQMIETLPEVLECIFEKGIDEAMNRFN